MTPRYVYRHSPDYVAAALSDRIIELYDDSASYPFSIALSGGSTPKVLFDYWCAHPEVLSGRDIHFWWVDERMVPMTSKDSNYGNAYRAVFGPIAYEGDKLHPIPYVEGQGIDDAVSSYNAEVEDFRQRYGKDHAFDLVVLGVGEDGHTSSLFPGQDLYGITEDFLRSVHPTNGIERVALSYEGIRRAPRCLFHVTGEAKAARLGEVISLATGARYTDAEVKRLPAAYAMRIASQVEIYTDIRPVEPPKASRGSRLLTALLNPSLLWLSVLPILAGWDVSVGGLFEVSRYILSTLLLTCIGILQSLLRINYRSLFAYLPLLLLIPSHKVILSHILGDTGGAYSIPLLFALVVVASIWGMASVGKCDLSRHPICRELLFSYRLMGFFSLAYLLLYVLPLEGIRGQVSHLPMLTVALTWVIHAFRLWLRQSSSEGVSTRLWGEVTYVEEVRIAVVRGQEIWLTAEPLSDRPQGGDQGRYDLPYSTYVRAGEDRHTAVERLRGRLPKGLKPKFLLRYNTDDNDGGHIVYLYVLNLGIECPPPPLHSGEFWSISRISDSVGQGILAPIFAEEYQYLRHTILLANAIVSKRKCEV